MSVLQGADVTTGLRLCSMHFGCEQPQNVYNSYKSMYPIAGLYYQISAQKTVAMEPSVHQSTNFSLLSLAFIFRPPS